MHSLIPVDQGFLAAAGTTLALWNGSSASQVATGATYSDPIQHDYHSDRALLVNGAMTPSAYGSGGLTALTFTSGITSPEQLIGVTVFKGRAFYWKSESGFYYANAGGFQGDMAYFDLAPFSDGTVVKCFTYSTDAGDGTDDMFVALMSSGEALVYQGNDPSDVQNWQLISKYTMPPPLGYRGTCDLMGDQVILTREGILNFNHIVKNGNVPGGIGHKIIGAWKGSIATAVTPELWEVHYVPNKSLLIVTYDAGSGPLQFVFNMVVGQWCTFSGLASLVWATADGEGYYGIGTIIYRYDGYASEVTTTALPAYTQLGSDGLQRQLTAIRPVTNVNPVSIGMAPATDFTTATAPIPSLESSAVNVGGAWKSMNAFAFNTSYVLRTRTQGFEARWYSTQFLFKQGGPT